MGCVWGVDTFLALHYAKRSVNLSLNSQRMFLRLIDDDIITNKSELGQTCFLVGPETCKKDLSIR